jgi:hypothetical protein
MSLKQDFYNFINKRSFYKGPNLINKSYLVKKATQTQQLARFKVKKY